MIEGGRENAGVGELECFSVFWMMLLKAEIGDVGLVKTR